MERTASSKSQNYVLGFVECQAWHGWNLIREETEVRMRTEIVGDQIM